MGEHFISPVEPNETEEAKRRLAEKDSRAELLNVSPQPDRLILPSRQVLEKENCAQIMRFVVDSDGIIQVGDYGGLFIPEGEDRLTWENIDNVPERQLEKNVELGAAFDDASEGGKLRLDGPVEIEMARLAIGTAYVYLDRDGDAEHPRQMMVLRINNDYGNNIYAGWANTFSGLIKVRQPNDHPGGYARQSCEEVIPVAYDDKKDSRVIVPLLPSGWSSSHMWEYKAFKDKSMAVSGLSVESDLVNAFRQFRLEHSGPRMPESVDMAHQIDFSPYGARTGLTLSFGKQQQQGVHVTLSPAGTLEVQRRVELSEAPATFVDPEFGSMIVVAAVDDVMDFYNNIRQNEILSQNQKRFIYNPQENYPSLKIDKLIDGATGRVMSPNFYTNEAVEQLGYDPQSNSLDKLRLSPPTIPVLNACYKEYELEK